ncbi:MAG: C40 family peptidase [Bacteroidetes bacterium]|nr:C40 family peptidase [Bacteroidota bacterium]
MKNFTLASTILFLTFLFSSCRSSQELLDPPVSLKKERSTSKQVDQVMISPASKTIVIAPTNNPEPKHGIVYQVASELQRRYAALLDVVPYAISNFPLYEFIDRWYGVRYQLGGSNLNGIDCSAFVQRLYEQVFCTNLVRTAMEQFQNCRLLKDTANLKEGDLVFFHTRGHKRITHVGIYLANGFFVHASTSQGVMISSLREHYWSRYFAGGGKISALSL